MKRSFVFLFSLVSLLFSFPALAATTWTQPTPEELQMTSDPKAPGAEAEYLYLEDWACCPLTIYARIKIFTQKGIEDYSDVRMDYIKGADNFNTVEARTIHPDGAIIPFTGQPYNKEVVSYRGFTRMQKVFSMPEVTIGSILEYRVTINAPYVSGWYIQRPLYIRKAAFHYKTVSEYPVHRSEILPPGAKVTGTPMGGFDLVVDDIPPLPSEEDSPPMHALGYRVQFLYTTYQSAAEFWKKAGKDWSGYVNDVTYPSGKLKDAVDQMIASGDTDTQKLEKIYAAVMKLENTSFSRHRTKEEDKAQKVKIKNANDVWTAQRGDSEDLALLFVTMARAAKLKAYVMYVTDRSSDIFLKDLPDAHQLDDMIAIVNVDGKEMFFDPGERYCEFGKLKWTHTWTAGLRQTDSSGAELATTPAPALTDTEIDRHGELQLDDDGQLHGTLHISMTGSEALEWRQLALREDEDAAKKKFDTDLRSDLAPGIEVNTTRLDNLTDFTKPLLAEVEVSGTLGSKTGHRLLLPGTFFEAGAKTLFASDKRETPVYMQYPYTEVDQVRLKLPLQLAVESVPQDSQLSFAPNGDYVAKFRNAGGGIYQYGRRLRLANILYQTQDYAPLRDFFQKVGAQDQQQVVLSRTAATAAVESGKSQ